MRMSDVLPSYSETTLDIRRPDIIMQWLRSFDLKITSVRATRATDIGSLKTSSLSDISFFPPWKEVTK
jgi:hypothetical protein